MKGHESDTAAAELGSAGGSAGTDKQTLARRANAAKATAARMALSAQKRRELAARGGRATADKLSPKERAELARQRRMALSPEERSELAAAGGRAAAAKLTPEQRQERARRLVEARKKTGKKVAGKEKRRPG